MERAARPFDRIFRPFEGDGGRYPIAVFRVAFFAGVCVHFFPTLIRLKDHYGAAAVRTNEWNHWLFHHFQYIPYGALRAWSVLTMLACVAAITGLAPRLSAAIAGTGLYAFASFNGLHLQTLALIPTWAILLLWAILGGGNAVLSTRSFVRGPGATEPRLLTSLLLFQVLVSVFFSGVEKVLAGWPQSNELRVLFSYPRGLFVRDWVSSSPWLAGAAVSSALSWLTLLAELGTPILLLWKRTRVPALIVYEAFFLTIIATLAVPPLFYCIFAFGGLLALDDRQFASLGRRIPAGSAGRAQEAHGAASRGSNKPV